jgi:hypothetical protein
LAKLRQRIAISSHCSPSGVLAQAAAWASHISAFAVQEANDIIAPVWQTGRRFTLKQIRLSA